MFSSELLISFELDISVNLITSNYLNSSLGVMLLPLPYTCVILEAIEVIFYYPSCSSAYECTQEHLQL